MSLSHAELRSLAKEIANFVLHRLRKHQAFVEKKSSSSELQKQYYQILNEATKSGVIETFYSSSKKLMAVLIIHSNKTGPLRVPSIDCLVEFNTRSIQAKKWVFAKLLENKNLLNENFCLFLDSHYKSTLKDLLKLGLYVDLKVTVGNPKVALAALKKKYTLPNDLSHLGLSVEPLKNKSQAKKIVEIFSSELKHNSAYRWFKGNKKYLNQRLKQLIKSIHNPNCFSFVIKKGRTVVGYFYVDINKKDPIFKSRSNTEFIFDKSIQGMGISKWAYSFLLKIMVQNRIKTFIGGTNQLSILHLNKVMKRQSFAFVVRKGKPILPLDLLIK